MFAQFAYTASLWALPILLAITLHEAAHGWVAWKLGDDTAYRLGRVSFNPFRHVDGMGTILIPALLIVGVIFILPTVGRTLGFDLDIFVWIVLEPAKFLARTIAELTGAR